MTESFGVVAARATGVRTERGMRRDKIGVGSWGGESGCDGSQGARHGRAFLSRKVGLTKLATVLPWVFALVLLSGAAAPVSSAVVAGGTLFGADETPVGNTQLITVNTATGAGTAVGAGIGSDGAGALACDPATGNTLYAGDAGAGNLFLVNTATGAGSLIGPFGAGFTGVEGLAHNGTTLFGSDISPAGNSRLITINTATGAATTVGNIGFDTVVGLAFHGGTLFATDIATDQLITINTGTGAGAAVGAFGGGFNNVLGLEFCDFPPIPTLPQWAMILLALSLLTLATWEMSGRPSLFVQVAPGGTVAFVSHLSILGSLLTGQALAASGLGFYALFVGSVLAHDAVGAFMAGMLLGLTVEFYRRNRVS